MKEIITVTKSDLPPLEEYTEYLKKIWSSRMLTNNGELVRLLTNRLEECLKVNNLVLVVNGTVAIQLALRALEIKGEVITTPFTFSATTNVILWEGMKPVFADIDPHTFNIDPHDVKRKITRRTGAILAVHVYGNPCYVEELQEIAEQYDLKLIYDGAHAFGVEYNDRSVLTYGDISTLSFHATKVFHTIEGGALVVKDKELREKLELLRNHGIKSEEEITLPGTNAKMNEFQAAMGLCNLKYVNERIEMRGRIYKHYKEKLSGLSLGFQRIIASRYNYIYMPVCFRDVNERNRVYLELTKHGIKPRKYFYPLTANFSYFNERGEDIVTKYNLKIASDIASRILCLPLYPDLEIRKVDEIVDIIKRVVRT